ncbi:CRISPR-associated endoribonuclease Cas6 [Tuanshanicoccus lijuaniae]|uniref:CRISPR-associated endoribonuclease Cas6 n=1 Tax=Aerococcaceae bacterium zg-1292 TaxID=2774330 RepID=UPI001937A206|nr:CRISPR-associated endoribonuclease Cas6 [Aerococcaceae bacterium zg-1292]QQA36564.1 CRISPR-associated endoribonuclease Cas6 [Aerococcaceae bacterium zg-1292]
MKRIKIIFEIEKANPEQKIITDRLGVYLQGVLMRLIDERNAELLHLSTVKPYSQFVQFNKENQQYHWYIHYLDTMAEETFSAVLLSDDFSEFFIESLENVHCRILTKDIEILEVRQLTQEFYSGEAPKRIELQFLTPTTFKQDGQYVLFPDIRLIIQSMMVKYSAIVEKEGYPDEKFLEDIVRTTQIRHYQLRSQSVFVHRYPIIGFKGRITLELHGNETMRRYVYMLVKYATYSGIGIKSAMGMGAVAINRIQ